MFFWRGKISMADMPFHYLKATTGQKLDFKTCVIGIYFY